MELVTMQTLTAPQTAEAPGVNLTPENNPNPTPGGAMNFPPGGVVHTPGAAPGPTAPAKSGIFKNADGSLKWTAYAAAAVVILALGAGLYFLFRKQ